MNKPRWINLHLQRRVWELDLPLLDKMVLLVLAGHARPDGTSIFPAVASVAQEAGACVRSVQGAIKRLLAGGWINCVMPENRSKRRTREFSLDLSRLPEVQTPPQDMPNVVPLTPAADAQPTPAADAPENKQESKKVDEDARAREQAEWAERRKVWQAFNDARATVYGEEYRQPNPGGNDLHFAGEFLAMGLTVAECAAVFLDAMERNERAHPNAADPVNRLKYCFEPIKKAATKAGAQESRHADASRPSQAQSRGSEHDRLMRGLARAFSDRMDARSAGAGGGGGGFARGFGGS